MTLLELMETPARETLTDKMAAFFRRRAGDWLDVWELAEVGGIGGWRTRVSECRTRFGMDIEWRLQRWPDGRNRSQYRWQRP